MSILTLLLTVNWWLIGSVQDTPAETSPDPKQDVAKDAASEIGPRASDFGVSLPRESLLQYEVPRVQEYEVPRVQVIERLNEDIYMMQFAVEYSPFGKSQFGVHVRRADDTLRKHLKIKAGMGLVVESVVANSGAANAGIQVDDVLLKHDDQWLINSEQFTTLVQNGSVGQEVKVTLVREGLTQEVMVSLTASVANSDGGSTAEGVAKAVDTEALNPDDIRLSEEVYFNHQYLPEGSNCSDCHRANVTPWSAKSDIKFLRRIVQPSESSAAQENE